MFEAKQGKDEGPALVEFDLEKDLKADPGMMKATKETLDTRVQALKGIMRKGEDKVSFEHAQMLMLGYQAAQKVVGRIGKKMG